MRRKQQKAPAASLARAAPSPLQVTAWRQAWGFGADVAVPIGYLEPLPLPPIEACKPCLGGAVFWTEKEMPHRGWRCRICHPPPAGMETRQWSIDELPAAPAPPPPPPPPVNKADAEGWW